MDELMDLKWTNFNSNFFGNLAKYRLLENLCDATLVCEEKFFPVHKLVLSLSSDYFENIFSRTPCKHPFIIIKDTDPVYLQYLLQFMYEGHVKVPKTSLQSFLIAAKSLHIKGISSQQNNELSKSQPQNVNEYSDGEFHSKDHSLVDNSVTNNPSFHHSKSVSLNTKHKILQASNRLILETGITTGSNTRFNDNDFDGAQIASTSSEGQVGELIAVKDEPTVLNDELDFDYQRASFSPTSSFDENFINTESSLPCDPMDDLLSPNIDPLDHNNVPQQPMISSKSRRITRPKVQPEIKQLNCQYCPFLCSTQGHLVAHEKTHLTKTSYQCQYCYYRSVSSWNCAMHEKSHTSTKTLNPSNKKRKKVAHDYNQLVENDPSIEVSTIKKEIEATENFVVEFNSADHEKYFKCLYCNYNRKRKAVVETHSNIHTGGKIFDCRKCNFTTPFSAAFASHKKKNHGRKFNKRRV